MTKQCSLKEALIERKLDEFQPGWRNGEDIKAETKQKIRDYTDSKIQDDEIRVAACLSDYSIGHMAKKIRARLNLPLPNKTNKGNCKGIVKDGVSSPSDEPDDILVSVRKLASKFPIGKLKEAIVTVEKEIFVKKIPQMSEIIKSTDFLQEKPIFDLTLENEEVRTESNGENYEIPDIFK